MGLATKTKTWADQDNVAYTDINANFDSLYNEFNGNIENVNIKTSAAIDTSKISGTAVNLSSNQTLTGIKTFDKELVLKEVSTPSNPSSGYRKLYFKSDGLIYKLNSSGTEELATTGIDGWTQSTDTWTYASATTFTISSVDRTSTFTPGTRIKLTQTTAKYFVVVSSSYSTNTTVTVTGGSDYSLANAAITSPYYSYQANPQGYPGWFNYTVTWGGFSSDPSSVTSKFSVVGRACYVQILPASVGTSNAQTMTISLPIAAVTRQDGIPGGMAHDNGTSQTTTAVVNVAAASATASVYPAPNQGNWTNSGNKMAQLSFFYQI